MVDYFSKYLEVAHLSNKTREAVIMAITYMFARHGIPESVIAESMPFNSLKIKSFAIDSDIEVVTASPHSYFPKSNGLVERNLQTMKRLLKKSDESDQDAFLALLEFRETPISGMKVSPAELLMGRKL